MQKKTCVRQHIFSIILFKLHFKYSVVTVAVFYGEKWLTSLGLQNLRSNFIMKDLDVAHP